VFDQNKAFAQIKRAALKYTPESPTDYRRDRLPADADFAGMALADGVHINESQTEGAKASYIFLSLLYTFGAIILVVLGAYLPVFLTLPASVFVSIVAVLIVFLKRNPHKALHAAAAVFIPPGIALGMHLLAFRFWGAIFLAVIALPAILHYAKAPFLLWHEALFNDLQMDIDARDKARPISYRPDLPFLTVEFLIAVFLPSWSPFWAIVVVVLSTLFFLAYRIRKAKSTDPAFTFGRLLSLAATIASFGPAYRAQYRPYPGIWNPGDKLNRAVKAVSLVFVALVFFFTVALAGYSAWDAPLLRPQFQELFHGKLPQSPFHMAVISSLAPAVDWHKLPSPYSPPEGSMTDQEFFANRLKMSEKERKQGYERYLTHRAQRLKMEAAIDGFVIPALKSSPCLGLYLSAISLPSHTIAVVILWIFGALFAAVVPPLVLITTLFVPLRSALALQGELQSVAGADSDARTPWRSYVDRVRVSTHATKDPITARTVREAEHLFMGHEPIKGFPILLDRSILKQHTYILGGTGFGKTSLGIMPMLMQLIQGHRAKDGTITAMPPMLIIDLKGDKALFHTVRAQVERKAKEEGRSVTDAFRTFSCEIGHACHSFNPFDDLPHGTVELCNVYLDALNLNHGEGYGRSYYTMQSRSLLRQVLKNDKPTTFKELYDGLLKCKRSKAFREAYELVATIEALSDYEHIFNPGRADKAPVIHMPTVVRERQVVYFWLPAAEHSLTAKEIASLAVYAFYNAQREWVGSGDWKAQGKPRPEAFLVIDEFQRVASRNFPNILREARSFGMGIILAHQSASDLELPDVDLAAIVRENTRLKLFFAIQDPKERKLFSELSGDELAIQPSITYSFEGQVDEDKLETAPHKTTTSFTPIIKPRITKNDIIETSDHPFEYFMLVSQGAGYTQFGGYPIAVRTSYPLPTEVYEARSDEPWPAKDELGLPECVSVTIEPIEAADEKRLETLAAIDAAIHDMFDEDPSLRH